MFHRTLFINVYIGLTVDSSPHQNLQSQTNFYKYFTFIFGQKFSILEWEVMKWKKK
jgi:hypothetical protein